MAFSGCALLDRCLTCTQIHADCLTLIKRKAPAYACV
jgi:hypothetical protein